jgi:putative proteasome-type protease
VLDRTLKYTDSLYHAFRVGCLAFDSTRISSADVDYPMDTVVYPKDAFAMVTRRFEKERFADLSKWWQDRLRQSVNELPFESFEELFQGLPTPLEKLGKRSSTAKSNVFGLRPAADGSKQET